MSSNLQLIRNSKAAASLFAVGSALLIIASTLELHIEALKENRIDVTYTPSPAQITAFSFWILTIGGFIGAANGTMALNQLIQESRLSMEPPSIKPSVWIFVGFWLLFFGIFAAAIGSQQRANEEKNSLIIF